MTELSTDAIELQHPITNRIEEQKLISTSKFIFFSLLSFGLYQIWWMYKEWRFLLQKDQLDIMPAFRAFFSIFFLYSLFNRIQQFALDTGYSKTYLSIVLFILYLCISMIALLPDPYWLISLATVVVMILPFKAMNAAKRNSKDIQVVELHKLTAPQIALIVLGVIWWLLIILGLTIFPESQ